ncbi:lipolytic protein G-D-S-L [Burkholderia pseudomallei]|uniref:Lipase/acylhydrolase, putative n=3 Tax=Burkholderia pseudomallei TaxID=28450 RepID=Q3JYC9_BURP1|nr:SGNH/GDSL hydrolase family protein [Burkholderia pseudomallei]ABA50064.1 lipase/acylhydrolase, putative [Burkholderia pseudomallei 1710b]AFI68041.1 lipase/acylhydrolase [Burkholderia pseudomallei 1026b]AIP12616.1 GDSL-like Lipase/Acylhydrolase family protein [Burkholderia pseudomallei]AIP49828.1 GDSL-like Lipase/Acylhydrolase family protein [Burkholderia pseudomallei MSHR5858]AIP60939.1 GDSL-like Lipase/Acylhydrolase family protein [Burkholderia pseudomallei HBPUB10303a]
MTSRRWFSALSCCLALAASQPGSAAQADAPARWVASWATALQPIPDLAAPPPLYRAPDVAGRTVRQIVYPTLAGKAVRIRVSNAYGKTPLAIGEMNIGRSAGGAAVAAGSSTAVTFGGRRETEVPPGQERDSDPVAYDVRAGEPYALSLYLGSRQTMTVWHRVSNQVNYVSAPGNHTGDASPDAFRTRFTQSAWIAELAVEVQQPGAAAIAAVGDSITDGLRSSLNRNRRWPDALAARLERAGAGDIGVANLGISGNRLLSDSRCYGIALERRFERDVLTRAGVKVAVLLIGINDINFAAMPARSGLDCDAPHTRVDAQALIAGYRRVIAAAHARGVAVFGATLTPASLPPAREAIRREVNEWIRTSGAFDGVVDFDAALRDPAKPSTLLRRYNSGDDIHPSDAGYAAMAEAVPLERLAAAAGRR